MRIRVVPFLAVPDGAFFGQVKRFQELGPLHVKLALNLAQIDNRENNAVVVQSNDADKIPGMPTHFEMMDCVGYIENGAVQIQNGQIVETVSST